MTTSAPRTLAIVAALLGAGALVLRDPPTRTRATLDLEALASEVDRGADHVSPLELQALLLAKKVRAIDLRAPAEFDVGHVPGAENITLAALKDFSAPRDAALVLYSGGGIHASQAWFLLRARGFSNVKFLLGGYDEWLSATAPPPPAPQAPAPPASSAPSVQGPAPSASSLTPAEAGVPAAERPAPKRPAPAKKPREGC